MAEQRPVQANVEAAAELARGEAAPEAHAAGEVPVVAPAEAPPVAPAVVNNPEVRTFILASFPLHVVAAGGLSTVRFV